MLNSNLNKVPDSEEWDIIASSDATIIRGFSCRNANIISAIFKKFNNDIEQEGILSSFSSLKQRRWILEKTWIKFWTPFYANQEYDSAVFPWEEKGCYGLFKSLLQSVLNDPILIIPNFPKGAKYLDFEILDAWSAQNNSVKEAVINSFDNTLLNSYPLSMLGKNKALKKDILQECWIDFELRAIKGNQYKICINGTYWSVFYFFRKMVEFKMKKSHTKLLKATVDPHLIESDSVDEVHSLSDIHQLNDRIFSPSSNHYDFQDQSSFEKKYINKQLLDKWMEALNQLCAKKYCQLICKIKCQPIPIKQTCKILKFKTAYFIIKRRFFDNWEWDAIADDWNEKHQNKDPISGAAIERKWARSGGGKDLMKSIFARL